MGKDPAVLFYTSDFLTGTMTFTDEQVGKYIRLLCLQHQIGKLAEKDMLYMCKTYDKDIFSKFIIGEDGFYRNERMRIEAERRVAYSASRRANRTKDIDDMNIISSSYVPHMETETETENEDQKKKKSKPVKIEYAEFVSMTAEEYEKLKTELTEPRAIKAIKILNNYKGSSGKKYKSDYMTMFSWVIKQLEKDESEAKHSNNGKKIITPPAETIKNDDPEYIKFLERKRNAERMAQGDRQGN